MHITIIEKDEQDAQRLLQFCLEYFKGQTVYFHWYPSYLEWSKGHHDILTDILFSDIYLEEENEILWAKKIKEQCPHIEIIFYSSNLQYSLLTYEVNHAYFFLKEDMKNRIDLAIDRAQSHLHKQIFS